MNKRYDQYDYQAPTGSRILLHADPTTGALNKTPLDELPGSESKFTRLNSTFSNQVTSGTSQTDTYPYTIPGNTLVNNGDLLRFIIWGDTQSPGGQQTVGFDLNGTINFNNGYFNGYPFIAEVKMMKVGTNLIRLFMSIIRGGGNCESSIITDGSIDLTASINQKWTIQCATSGSITARASFINKELI